VKRSSKKEAEGGRATFSLKEKEADFYPGIGRKTGGGGGDEARHGVLSRPRKHAQDSDYVLGIRRGREKSPHRTGQRSVNYVEKPGPRFFFYLRRTQGEAACLAGTFRRDVYPSKGVRRAYKGLLLRRSV